jgi:hypothetical protein
MKTSLSILVLTGLTLGVLLGTSNQATAADVAVSPSQNWIGYMNWTPIPQLPGTGTGSSGWGTADLCASWSGPTLTLSPNTIGDPNSYWYVGGGAPGNPGAKMMDASFYVEATGLYVGENLTFSGNVLQSSLLSSVNQMGNGWTSVAFIKDFAPDYSSFTTVTVPLSPGFFSITLATSANPLDHIQYGFETIGPDVWATDPILPGLGNITIVPEPSSLALLGVGALGALVWRRRQ